MNRIDEFWKMRKRRSKIFFAPAKTPFGNLKPYKIATKTLANNIHTILFAFWMSKRCGILYLVHQKNESRAVKILAVDDDPLILQLLRKMLGLSGFGDVALAESAVEAAQLIARADPPFECFLFDMRMPEIEGDDLCYWVRHLPSHASTPIVMVTALASKADVDRAFAAGASDYITKPIDLADLDSRLRNIKKKRAERGFQPPKSISLLGENRDGIDRVDFNSPMQVGAIPGEISIQSLENYLNQISQTGPHNIYAFAFAVQDAAKLHFISSRDEFTGILQATGKSISKQLNAPGFFLSYTGGGTFAGVIQATEADVIGWETIELSIQESLRFTKIPAISGAPMNVVPYAGMPRRLSARSGEKIIRTLYHVIIEAEERGNPLKDVA
ncbi:MAG: hypothetical protein COB40_12915 [Marinosulfonomonas sp.]|nr:MAG: hypothetical protein COB40_12915 [Marinosulfonomonas sp.]